MAGNLCSFWNQDYAEAREELRGRYPKHHCPEDPATAQLVPLGRKRTHHKNPPEEESIESV
ncbi:MULTISPECIES: ATP-dependent helicase C-terminal domain-containing protein [Thiorhodovibrio]|uniref:ATP-dependent helicase C-terminal domain-containing protein n=1 Tax=Thiorhodovibrio TaxID=61593 RepID=UPI002B260C07|nr:ATP-dependent helicase C-terminal domain-containing protein [Thiorhodovibrio litoralis]